MEETAEGVDRYLEKLALISEGIDVLHEGKKAIVFELNRDEFIKLRDSLKTVGEDKTEFKIDISGIEFIYLLNES
jgi:hypothetical protein